MHKVLIIGNSGQLGRELEDTLRPYYEIIAAGRSNCDITKDGVESFIESARPKFIINCAAIHNTEECEKRPDECFATNALGALRVSKISKKIGSSIIFISTDYVFDGHKESFSEADCPNPINTYGVSKLAGEMLTKIGNDNHYIIRTSWLYGRYMSKKGYNFVTMMIDKAKRNEHVKVVDDQFGSPTYAKDLAEKILELINKNAPYGTYHITNGGMTSWYHYAKTIFELSGVHPKEFSPIKTAESGTQLRRPKYSTLANSKLAEVGIESMRNWKEPLEEYIKSFIIKS